jgi:hypothetical protein
VAGGIPGWAPLDERTLTGDPAYRPIAEVIREVFRVYRSDGRRFLLASAAIEIPLALLTAPYLAVSWGVLADTWQRFPTFDVAAGYAIYADPGLGVLGGIAFASPVIGFVLVAAVVAGVVLRPPGEPDSGSARADRGLRITIICAAILGVGAILGLAWSRVMAGWLTRLSARPDPGSVSAVLGLAVLGLEILVFAAVMLGGYGLVRSGLAIPALVSESHGIRAALARSLELTRRRSMRTALTLTVGLAIVAAANTAFSLSAFALVLATSSADLSSVALPIAGLFLLTSVVVAPVLPIIAAILYRDFRAAGALGDPA